MRVKIGLSIRTLSEMRSLLDTPLRNLLADRTIDFPFALCWANENWTRSWDGLEADLLVSQRYGDGWRDGRTSEQLGMVRPDIRPEFLVERRRCSRLASHIGIIFARHRPS